jgi:drug/metabolite transporter (DMT)-like permease
MTVLINVLVLGVVAIFVIAPAFDGAGVVALLLGGMVGTVGGRFFNLRSVRLIGPSRANAFMAGTPVVAAAAGWLVLGEELTPIEALGGAIAIAGLLWLVRGRARVSQEAAEASPPVSHYLVAAAAPIFFGLAFVIKKWGLERYPNSVLAAFLGAAAAFTLIVTIDLVRGRIDEVYRANLRSIPWWFVAAGVATSAALLFQFLAFARLPAWVVGVLQSTQGLWTIALSFLFLRGDEHIDRTVIGSVILVVAGVTIIGLQT